MFNDRLRALARREALSGALLLTALLVVTHYDVIFLGRSLIATNYSNPIDWRELRQNYGPRRVPHAAWTSRNLLPYANIRDAGATWWQWEPSTHFLKQAIHDREWPFWDPYTAGGTPAMANLLPAFFFPPYLAVVLLGASVALLNAYFLFLAWAPAFFTFLFVRRHDVGFLPAITAGAAVMLGGMVHQHLGTFIGQTAACLPFVLYATRRFFDRPSAGRGAALALAYAVAALASFPPVLLAIFSIASLYGCIALLAEPTDSRLRVGTLWLAAVAISIGLVAFQYVPALMTRAATPQMELYRDSGLETMPGRNLYQIVSPTLMGGIQTYWPAPIQPRGPYIPYIGVVAVALALIARVSGSPKRRTLLLASTLAILAILLKITGSPILQWVGDLPGLNQIHIANYFGMPVGFLIACLAALGLHAVLEGAVGAVRAVVAAGVVGAIPASLWYVAQRENVFSSPALWYWLRDWWILAAVSVAAGLAIAIGALQRNRPGVRFAAGAFVALLLVGDLIFMGWYPNPRGWSTFEHPVPFVRVLQKVAPHDRVFTVGGLDGNLGSGFRVFTMESLMAFNPPRSYGLYHRYSKSPLSVFMHHPAVVPPDIVLDRANVAAIVINHDSADMVRDIQARGYQSVFDDGFVAVFVRKTLPRFLFSSEYRVVSAGRALEEIAGGAPAELVLEQDPGVPRTPNSANDPRVEVESYRLNSAAVVIEAPRAGLLYASEAFFDGWTAFVNGKPVTILPANYAFRAVPIPAGRVCVEFRYRPPGLTAGLAVSGSSLLAVCALAFVRRLTRETGPVSGPRTTSAAP